MLIGAALMYAVFTKGQALLQQVTPRGVAERIERKGHETASGLGDFYATFRTAMAEREAELNAQLAAPQQPV